MEKSVSRRGFLGAAAGTATLMSMASSIRALAAGLPLPTSPVSLNIVDAAGNLALTQPAFNNYKTAHPELVSRLVFNKATAPELPGKIKAQQAANKLDIDIVIVGPDALSAGMATDMWVDLVGMKDSGLPDLKSIYLDRAWSIQQLAKGYGVTITSSPGGPLLEYLPDKVKTPPKTIQDLLDWAKQNPNKFIYAQPANSGPGRAFLMGLPYLLKDSNPKDPTKGWDKTWAYLVELGKNIEYYPTGTGAVMKELAEGSRDMIASHLGWDLNPRILGVVPMEAQIGTLEGFHWVTDAQYWAIPKGVSPDKLAVLLDMTKYMLTRPAQAMT